MGTTVKKATIGVIVAVIPIVILIYVMVNFTILGLAESTQRVNEANNGVDTASMNVLNACGDLYNQFQNIEVQNGPGSDQLNQFVQGSSDSIKRCVTSLQSIQDSCKSVPSMQACKDPRLQELSSDFSRIKP